MAQMRQGLAAWRATGAGVFQPYYLALLAEAYGAGGQAEEGLRVLAEALTVVDNTGSDTGRQSCIGSRASCCCGRLSRTRTRQKPASSRPSPLPAASRRSRWSCGLP